MYAIRSYYEPMRAAAIRKAIETGTAALTAPIRLVQGDRKSFGALVLSPAYARDIV